MSRAVKCQRCGGRVMVNAREEFNCLNCGDYPYGFVYGSSDDIERSAKPLAHTDVALRPGRNTPNGGADLIRGEASTKKHRYWIPLDGYKHAIRERNW